MYNMGVISGNSCNAVDACPKNTKGSKKHHKKYTHKHKSKHHKWWAKHAD
jgi:hypothetical protein